MKNPCQKDCPDRAPGCKTAEAACPKLDAFQRYLQAIQKERERERLLDGYQVSALYDNRKRYGWKNGRPKL